MADEPSDVPPGAAVLPEIPEELNVQPLLLAALHAVVFIAGSDEAIVHPAAAAEALERVAAYFRRLSGRDLERVRADLEALADLARQEEWGQEEVELFRNFLSEFDVE
jgi:hypothetical protein